MYASNQCRICCIYQPCIRRWGHICLFFALVPRFIPYHLCLSHNFSIWWGTESNFVVLCPVMHTFQHIRYTKAGYRIQFCSHMPIKHLFCQSNLSLAGHNKLFPPKMPLYSKTKSYWVHINTHCQRVNLPPRDVKSPGYRQNQTTEPIGTDLGAIGDTSACQ